MTHSTSDNGFLVLMTADCLSDIVVINRVLSKRIPGFREVWVNSGEELLDYLEGVGKFSDPLLCPRPSLILLAENDSDAISFRTLRLAARRGFTRRFPFIMISERVNPQDEHIARQLGAHFILAQPIDKLKFDDQLSALAELGHCAA